MAHRLRITRKTSRTPESRSGLSTVVLNPRPLEALLTRRRQLLGMIQAACNPLLLAVPALGRQMLVTGYPGPGHGDLGGHAFQPGDPAQYGRIIAGGKPRKVALAR